MQVSLPYGPHGDKTVHPAEIEDISEYPAAYGRNVKVRFKDRHIYGGMGYAWVNPSCLAGPEEEPAPPETWVWE